MSEDAETVVHGSWKPRMTAAMLDVMVATGTFDGQAAREYNEYYDTAQPAEADDAAVKWMSFTEKVYRRLFRCPLPACDRLMVHETLPDGSERFSCTHRNDHIDSAVTGLNGTCFVYMDLQGRVSYVSAAETVQRPEKKRLIPRKAVVSVTNDRPSILSQLLAARAAHAVETSGTMAHVVSPVLASQMDESKVDNVLLSLLSVLRALHLLFYAHYTTPLHSSESAASISSLPPSAVSSSQLASSTLVAPSADFSLPLPADCTLPSLLLSLKTSVLHGCHILFSGAFPSALSAVDTDIGKLAVSFGAVVYDGMDASGRGLLADGDHRITHIVAARDGSDKIKAGLRLKDRRPLVVHLSWLFASAAHFQRADERLFPLSLAAQADADEKAGVGGKENARGYVSPAFIQHTQTPVTPLQLLRGLQKCRPSAAALTAMRAALEQETNHAGSNAAEEKKEPTGSSLSSGASDNGSASEGRVRRKRKMFNASSSGAPTPAASQDGAAVAENNADTALGSGQHSELNG